MRQTHFAARLRVPSCPFVVKPPPHGFVLLRASSWSNLNRKASRSLVAQRALRATKNHSAWSSRPLAALRGQILRRKASCSFVALRGQPSSARLRASSCLFVVKPPPQGFASLSVPSRTKSHPPQGFVSLRASSWSTLRRMASCFFVPLRGKNLRRKASRPLAALRGQILRRKASCSFVSLRGQHSAARLRASSCLFVVKPPPQGFASLSGPSRTNNSAARLRVPSCPFVVKANSTARQEPLSGKTNPGKHVLQHISPKFPPKTLATPQKAPIFASRAAASGPTFGGTETTFPLPTTEKSQKRRK